MVNKNRSCHTQVERLVSLPVSPLPVKTYIRLFSHFNGLKRLNGTTRQPITIIYYLWEGCKLRYVIDILFQLAYHVVIQDRLLVKFCVVKSEKLE